MHVSFKHLCTGSKKPELLEKLANQEKFPSTVNNVNHVQARCWRQHAGFGDIPGEQKHICAEVLAKGIVCGDS